LDSTSESDFGDLYLRIGIGIGIGIAKFPKSAGFHYSQDRLYLGIGFVIRFGIPKGIGFGFSLWFYTLGFVFGFGIGIGF
jgi:hypothetical protein